MTRAIWTLLVLGIAGCAVEHAVPKPDLSGTWVLDLSRTSLEITPPDSSIFVIDHVEPVLSARRTHALDGVVDVVETQVTADSVLRTVRVGELEIPTRVYWEGDVLILEQAWSMGGTQITNVVRYSLMEDGRTLRADELMEAGPTSHHNVWVFGRR